MMIKPERQEREHRWRLRVCQWLGLTSAGVDDVDLGDHEVTWRSQVKESPRVPVTSFGRTPDGYYGTVQLSPVEFSDLLAKCGRQP